MNFPSWEKIFFYSEGRKLCGLLYHQQSESSPVIIVCHGFAGSKEGKGKALEMAQFFGEEGINFFLFDFSGVGESEGKFEDITLSRQVKDLEAAIDTMVRRNVKEIFLMGRSLGGTTVLALDHKKYPRIKGVISLNGAAFPYELFKNFISQDLKGERILLGDGDNSVVVKRALLEDLRKWDILQHVKRLSPIPLLIIHGEMDEVVPVENAKELYLHARQPKKLVIIEGEDHQFSHKYKRMWKESLEWVKYVSSSGSR